jgi:hypothetical protein
VGVLREGSVHVFYLSAHRRPVVRRADIATLAGCCSLRRLGPSRHAGRCSELDLREVSDRGPSPARGDASGVILIPRRKFCRGKVIHRRLRGVARGSPRPRRNNFGAHISDPARKRLIQRRTAAGNLDTILKHFSRHASNLEVSSGT